MTTYPEKASPHIPQSSNGTSYFAQQLTRPAAYTGPVLGSTPDILFGNHHHHHPQVPFHLYPQPRPHPRYLSYTRPFPPLNMHESAVLREMEKQQIREEIIFSEIMRKRVLEEEVWREIAMEREMAFQRGGNNGTQFGSAIGFEMPKRLLPLGTGGDGLMSREEDKIISSFDQKEKGLGGSSRTSPLLRISEFKPPSKGSKEKVTISSLANANVENTTGLKRKTSSPAEEDHDASLSDARKKAKGWFCEVCHISATSERSLNEHMQGKKHKTIEQRAGKNFKMGMFSKKTTPIPKHKLMDQR